MAKNKMKKGKSARNGNAPSPYTRYDKKPYRYSEAYYTWKKMVTRKGTKEIREINRTWS